VPSTDTCAKYLKFEKVMQAPIEGPGRQRPLINFSRSQQAYD
jgi:hypothetical protein